MPKAENVNLWQLEEIGPQRNQEDTNILIIRYAFNVFNYSVIEFTNQN